MSEIAFDDRRRVVQDALIVTLQNRFPVGSVMEHGILVATASTTDKFAFQCDNRAAIVCPPTVYADVVSEASEEMLLEDLVQERDPREDELLRDLIGAGNLHLFMHMYGYGEGNDPGCVPCLTTVEAHRAFRRKQCGGHSYFIFDEEFVSLGHLERSI
jgi:hypothetical protein